MVYQFSNIFGVEKQFSHALPAQKIDELVGRETVNGFDHWQARDFDATMYYKEGWLIEGPGVTLNAILDQEQR